MFNPRNIAGAIATLRKQYKLRQSDIVGLSARQVSRIENGESTKPETLELFAKAHNREINNYLEAIAFTYFMKSAIALCQGLQYRDDHPKHIM